jgi:IS5 family transposase
MGHCTTSIQRYVEHILTSANGTGRIRCRLFVSDDLKLRTIDRDDYYNEALMKRKDVERKFREGKLWHELRRARYRGKWRITIQVLLTFIVLNIKRMVKILKENPNKVPNYGTLALEMG